MRPTKGEEKLTVRLPERELKAIDAHVHAGGFRTRSDFVRTAIEQYLSYNLETVTRASESPEEVRVRLKEHEIDLVSRYVEMVTGGNLADALAMLARHGMYSQRVQQAVHDAEEILAGAQGGARPVLLNRGRLESADQEPASSEERRHTRRGG